MDHELKYAKLAMVKQISSFNFSSFTQETQYAKGRKKQMINNQTKMNLKVRLIRK